MFNFTKMKMKKTSLLGVFFLSVMLMFTSCLGDGSNVIEYPALGVVTTHPTTFQKVIDVGGIYYYAPDFLDKSDGSCWWIYYQLDKDSDDNANAGQTGIYTVTILNKYEYERHNASYMLTDTTKLLEKELAIIHPAYNNGIGYIKGRLFLEHALNQPNKQQNDWDLSYNSQNMFEEENGERVYECYIRATIKTESSNSAENQLIPCAYYMKDFFETAARKEKSDNKTSMSFRIHYVSEIKDEKITWAKTEKINIPIAYIITEDN